MEEEKKEEQLVTKAQETAISCGGIGDWLDKGKFDQILRVSQMLSRSHLVPQQYQGNVEDCTIALDMAARMGVNPMMVMQNLYVVKGKPSWSGQACMALINASGKFYDVKHVYFGKEGTDERGCYVTAIRYGNDEIVNGTKVTIQMAKAEGWTSNSKWKNMPEQMLAYRAASFFARIYCPEMLMGCQTADEVADVFYSKQPKASNTTDALNAAMTAEKENK